MTQPSFRRYLLSVATVVTVASLGAVLLVDLPIARTHADGSACGAGPSLSLAGLRPRLDL